MGMDFDHREMPVDKAKPVAKVHQNLREDWLRSSAMWTLIVAIFDKRHDRVVVTQDVVKRRYGHS